jgi:serine/threonine protein kinase/tetratricopeptide (TPR) repeat protein
VPDMNDSAETHTKRSNRPDGSSLIRLRASFDIVMELPTDARVAWIVENVTDPHERAMLARLLESAEENDRGFLDTPVVEHANKLAADNVLAETLVGQRIGAFRLVRLLGKGGMAAVFLGAREGGDFNQNVAIKLLRRGLYSEIEQRLFLRERQVLASLNHPNVARLFDGGLTDAGIPYLVMEYVDGQPITRYAAQHALNLPARLNLFLTVCRAVEAAHRALIVHRDIKPSNILVATDGTVKLLDFGIAKLLEDNVELGTVGLFTPDYAAPEQLAAQPVTTATDVYSLGVLLHELLVGARPGSTGTSRRPSAFVANETQQMPGATSPGQLRKLLRGDLDNMVMKAIDADPARRYTSAGTFADDVERLLDGRPVTAHPPSGWYRTRKFIVRHRAGVLTLTAVVLAVFAALGIALWQRGVAKQEAARANVVRDFLVSVFQSAGADLPRDKQPSADELVEQATKRLMGQNRLSDATRADLLLALAKVSNSVNAYDRALSLLDRSQPIVDTIYDADDSQWLDSRVTRASALDGKNDDAAIISLLDPLRAKLLALHDEIGFGGLGVLGMALARSGPDHVDDALDLFKRARQAAEAEAARQPNALLTLSIQEGMTLVYVRRFREGLDRAEAAIALWRQEGEQMNPHIAELYGDLALGAEATGDMPRAEAAYKEAIALDHRFFDKPSPRLAWDVGMYGSFLVAQGRYAEAESYLRNGLDLRKAVFGENDPSTLFAISAMGRLFTGQNKFDEAEKWYSQGIEICRKTALKHKVCPQLLSLRGDARSSRGHFEEAEQDLREAMDTQKAIGGATSPAYAYTLKVLANLEVRQHRYEEAIVTADQVLAISKSVKGGMIQSDLDTRYCRARALFELKRRDEALTEILDVEAKYSSMFPNAPSRFGMLQLKARALEAAHRYVEAAKAAQDALALPNKSITPEPESVEELKRLAALLEAG